MWPPHPSTHTSFWLQNLITKWAIRLAAQFTRAGLPGTQCTSENWHQPQERAQLWKLMLQVILAIKNHVQLNGFVSHYLGGPAVWGGSPVELGTKDSQFLAQASHCISHPKMSFPSLSSSSRQDTCTLDLPSMPHLYPQVWQSTHWSYTLESYRILVYRKRN